MIAELTSARRSSPPERLFAAFSLSFLRRRENVGKSIVSERGGRWGEIRTGRASARLFRGALSAGSPISVQAHGGIVPDLPPTATSVHVRCGRLAGSAID